MRSLRFFSCGALIAAFYCATFAVAQEKDSFYLPLDSSLSNHSATEPAVERIAMEPAREMVSAGVYMDEGTDSEPIPQNDLPQDMSQDISLGGCPCNNDIGLGYVPLEQCCWKPRWTVTTEAIVLDRSTTPRAHTILSNAGGEVLNASNLASNFDIGPRVSLIHHNLLHCGLDLEFNYFGITGWGGQTNFAAANGPYFLSVDNATPLLAGFTDATFFYGGKIHSGELNLRCEMTPWLTFLAGYRHIQYSERYLVWSVDGNVHSIGTGNMLHGGQVGAECRLWEFCNSRFCKIRNMTLDMTAKAGAFHNFADQASSLTTAAGATNTAGASRGHTAAIAEIGIKLVMPLSAYTDLSFGYQAMWIEGVAVAPDQIQTTGLFAGTTSVDVNGSPFLHGGFFGFTSRF